MRFHDFSHKRVKSAFKLKMHVKCIQIRTSCTALMNVKEFKFTNRHSQAFIAFGQWFSLLFMFFVLFICLNKLCKIMTWKKTCGKNNIELQNLFYVNWIRTFQSAKVCAYKWNKFGIWDEIERLSSWHEIERQLRVVKLNEYLSKLNEIKFKRNDIKRN